MCPIYEYSCESCGHKDEKLEPLSAPEIQDCPKCLVKNVFKRILSITAFALSGQCWFKDGYNN